VSAARRFFVLPDLSAFLRAPASHQEKPMKTLLRAAFFVALLAPAVMANTTKLRVVPTPPPEPTITTQNTGSSAGPEVVVLLLLVLVLVGAASGNHSGSQGQVQPSDARLKTAIRRSGTAANGLPLYRFRYRGLPAVFEGVMAQDVVARFPEAVIPMPSGYMAVNYARLGLRMRMLRSL
jgi:hypothetical protein